MDVFTASVINNTIATIGVLGIGGIIAGILIGTRKLKLRAREIDLKEREVAVQEQELLLQREKLALMRDELEKEGGKLLER
jgi:hypothetical protein